MLHNTIKPGIQVGRSQPDLVRKDHATAGALLDAVGQVFPYPEWNSLRIEKIHMNAVNKNCKQAPKQTYPATRSLLLCNSLKPTNIER